MKQYQFYLFAGLIALITADFMLPHKHQTQPILEKIIRIESGHNAARKTYNTFALRTKDYTIAVEENIYKRAIENQEIDIAVSALFNKVGTIKLPTGETQLYSFRIFTGLILPLLVLLILCLHTFTKLKLGILYFVAQAVLVGDAVYILFF